MIPSSGCPPWPPDHPRTLPRTGTPTPPRGARPSQGWTLKRVRPGPKRWPWSGREPSRPKPLDIKGPIQGLLRLHSRYCYGLSDCSIARGDLCHEASARWVAPPNRSSATSATDNSLGGTFLHWQTAPSGRTEFFRLRALGSHLFRKKKSTSVMGGAAISVAVLSSYTTVR